MRPVAGLFLLALLGSGVPVACDSLLPLPSLESVDDGVRQQLTELHAEAQQLLADNALPVAVSSALAILGETYLAYDFSGAAQQTLALARDHGADPFRTSYLLGYALERSGDLPAAVDALQRAVSTNSEDAAAQLRLGKVLVSLDRLDEARAPLKKAARLNCPTAEYGLGEIDRRQGRDEAAIEHFKNALEQQPSHSQARYGLGLALRKAGRMDEAAETLAQVDLSRAKVGGDSWEGCADPLLDEVSRLASSSAVHQMRAAMALIQGDRQRALSQFRLAVEAGPDDDLAHKGLAGVLASEDQFGPAIEHLQEAIRLNPADASHHYDLAQLLVRTREFSRAKSHLTEATTLAPDFADAWTRMAQVNGLLQDWTATEHAAEKALALRSDDAAARAVLVEALLRNGKAAEARSELIMLLETSPPADPAVRLELASRLILLGESQAPRPHLEAIADSDASASIRALAHFRLGLIHLGLGEPQQAVSQIQTALTLDHDLEEGRAALQAAEAAAQEQTEAP